MARIALHQAVIPPVGGRPRSPGHCGPPCDETIPLIPVLTEVNRAGFVTDNSQQAGETWNAWVCGFVPDEAFGRLRAAIEGTPLIVWQWCRRGEHHCHGLPRAFTCPRRDAAGSWADRCPHAAGEIDGAWYVTVADPEPGRNDRLWAALAGFARS